jgi:hypothetical protein
VGRRNNNNEELMRRSTSLGNLNRTPIAGRYHGQGRAELSPLLTLICFLVFMSRTAMRDNPTGWCNSVWQIGSFCFAEKKTPLLENAQHMHYYSATLMDFCSEISVKCGSCISSSFLSFI